MLCPHCQKHTQGDPFSLPDADGQLTHPGCLTSAVRNGVARPPTLAQADLAPLDALWRQLKRAVAENDLEAAHTLVHEVEQTYHPWAARLRLAIALQGGFQVPIAPFRALRGYPFVMTFDLALAPSEIDRLEAEIADVRRGREYMPTLGHLVAVRLARIEYLRAELAKAGMA